MTRRLILIACALSFAACGNTASGGACDDLCDELVGSCHYSAFPDRESCLNGCGYAAELGSDISGQLSCVEAAECNTFAVLECEHAYGQVE